MSTQYRLVESGKIASGGCSAGPRFVRACSTMDLFIYFNSFNSIFRQIQLYTVLTQGIGTICKDQEKVNTKFLGLQIDERLNWKSCIV
jgi:hypothetical protein